MAQVESNSDPKFSKGGGSAKKHQGKPGRDSLDAMIKQLKALVPHLQEDELERVLEKNNYDINKSADYIYDGNPIPTESSEWQQVSRNSKQETKAKTQDKRNDIVEKKEKVNRTDSDKRIDREDKRNDGRSDRKPKKPDARFGTDGAPDIHRAPRDRDSKSNGSPNPQSRPPRRSPAPTHAGAPTTKPAGAQPLQTQPTTQTPHPSISNQHTWGPPGGSAHAQAPVTTTPPPTNPTPSQQPAQSQSQSQAPSQPQPSSSTAGAAATRPSYTSAAATSLSYAKIVQGKPQPTPPPQQVTPHPPTSSQQTTAANAAGAPTSTPPSNTHPSTGAPGKQPEFQQSSPSGSRAHNRASPTWRPKEPSSSSVTSPSLATTPATSAATATTTQATAPVSTTTTQAVSLPATQQPATTTPSQPAAPVQAAQPSPVAQAPIQAAAPQVAQTQPAPISPPTAATTQPKKQPVVVGAGGVIFPPSLQYADNLSIPFGSFGLENKSNDQGLVLHFGTQPTTPAQQAAPIAAQQAASPSAVPAQQPVSTAQVPVQQQQVHPSHSSPHSQHVSPQHAAPTPASAHQQQPGSHVPSHLPSQQQQQLHLNGDPNLGGHLDQTDVHGYPYMPSPYFHMPGFGFADGNPDDRMRAYYDHPTGASYAPADSNTAQSAVPQNSQSPPPNSPSQYHMQPYYNPYYNMHPYYQTSAPSQFQQFPGSYIYGYNRMGAGGYPPAVHSSSSPASQAHSQYEEADYKYLNQPQSSYNFYSSSSPAASTSAGSVPGSASSVKPASYSPTPTAGVDSSNKDYNNKYRTEPSSFYNNLSSPQGPHSHSHSHSHSQQFSHQPHSFMGQHNIGGPQSIPSQSSAYHHSPQPLSNQQHVQGQSGGSQRPYPGLS